MAVAQHSRNVAAGAAAGLASPCCTFRKDFYALRRVLTPTFVAKNYYLLGICFTASDSLFQSDPNVGLVTYQFSVQVTM